MRRAKFWDGYNPLSAWKSRHPVPKLFIWRDKCLIWSLVTASYSFQAEVFILKEKRNLSSPLAFQAWEPRTFPASGQDSNGLCAFRVLPLHCSANVCLLLILAYISERRRKHCAGPSFFPPSFTWIANAIDRRAIAMGGCSHGRRSRGGCSHKDCQLHYCI